MTYEFERAETGGLVFKQPGVPLNPSQTDAFLQVLNNELEVAGAAVRAARKHWAACKEAFETGETRLLMSPECPRVGRTASDVTVAERDAWVRSQIGAEYKALHFANVRLDNATDYAWQVKEQVSLLQSLNNNAKATFDSYPGGNR